MTEPTIEEKEALDEISRAFASLNKASKSLSGSPDPSNVLMDLIEETGSHVEALDVGKPVISDETYIRIQQDILNAKTSSEELQSFLAFLTRLGIAAGKALS